MSISTHPSLLSRLRADPDQSAWREFDSRYGDLLVRYACRRGLQHSDAEDVRQLVMIALLSALPKFQYSQARGHFRAYLGKTVRRAVNDFLHRERPIRGAIPLHVIGETQVEGEDYDDALWESEWVGHHFRVAMRTVRATYDSLSIQVFEQLLAGKSVRDVSAEMAMSEEAVYKIKQRIRNRMRELILAQLRDEEERACSRDDMNHDQ